MRGVRCCPGQDRIAEAFLGAARPWRRAPGQAVEIDRLLDGHVLPHDDILEIPAPILRRGQGERTLTPLRLFCQPFQDLLTGRPRRTKQKGVIARANLVPVWNWIVATLLPTETAHFSRRQGAGAGASKDESDRSAPPILALAAAGMQAALVTEGDRRAAKRMSDA